MTTELAIREGVATRLVPFVQALLHASGITEGQARIGILYALCTYRDDLDRMPILAVIGKTGTGKSTLLDELTYFVREPKKRQATTYATMRDEMTDCKTYVIHEADFVRESLLQSRTDKTISTLTHNVGTGGHGWQLTQSNLFGATILARRNPFRDSAVRNRAIVIQTKTNPGDYSVEEVQGFGDVFQQLRIDRMVLGSGRVRDTWTPLLEVAKAIGDPAWTESAERAIEAENTIFASGQQYEAEDVVLNALDALTWHTDTGQRLDQDVELPDLTKKAAEIGDVALTKKQVEEILISKGFKVTFTHGDKFVRSNPALLDSLLAEL